MSKIIDIPFNDGQDEGTDRFLLPEARFRLLQNCRLSRDGRLEVRPNYASLGNSAWEAAGTRVRAFDLVSYDDRLLMLGAIDSVSFTPAYPRELYSWINTPQAAWKGLSDSGAPHTAYFPFVSDFEIFWNMPFGQPTTNCDIAYANGLLAVVSTNVTAQITKVFILHAGTGAVLRVTSIASARSSRVVACGSTLVLLTRFVNGDINAQTFDTTNTSAFGFSGNTNLVSAESTDVFTWDAAPVAGSTDFVISYTRTAANAMRVRRYTVALGLSWTFDLAATRQNSCVIADTTLGVMFAFTSAARAVVLYTLNQATGAITSGPTTVLGPGSAGPTNNLNGTPFLAFTQRSPTPRVTVGATSEALSAPAALDFGTVWTIRNISAHTLISSGALPNVASHTKAYTQEQDSANQMAQFIGTMHAAGGSITLGSGATFSNCINSLADGFLCAARWNYGFADHLVDSNSSNYHGRSSIVTDGAGIFYGLCSQLDESGIGTDAVGTLQVVKFKSGSADRRQMTEMQGALYTAGGFSGYYDGSNLIVESGFLDTPEIVTVAATAGGGMTLLGAYVYVAVYEWYDALGRIHRSTPSTPYNFALSAANQSATITVTSARSLRRADVSGQGSLVKTVIYRTTPGDSVFYRVADGSAAVGTTSYAATFTILDTVDDNTAQTRPILYTQAQKPTANVGMQPSRFVAAGRDRLIFGGLPDPYVVQFSQLAFPGEPIENASPNNFAYVARLPQKVTAVACPGDSYLAFTADAVYSIPGSGPQRNGTGEFGYPSSLYVDGGCINWKSVVTCSAGTFFQMASDKLMLLSADGSGVQFVGQPIRDQLTSFPNITGAALCTATQRVVFSAINAAGNDGVLLIYDLRRGVWTVDNVGVVTSVVEYLGRVAYIQTGNVFLENAAIGSGVGALPALSARTGSLKLFGGSGYGMLEKVILQATYLGASTLEAFMSVDDGVTWDSLGTVDTTTLTNPRTGAAIASGDPITLTWIPKTRQVDRFALRVDCTNGTDTGGARLHMLSIEVDAKEFATRQPANNRR